MKNSRKLALGFGTVGFFATAALGWQAIVVNDGESHGDPPFLLEPGWQSLIQGNTLNGWTYEHPEKGKWSTSAAIYWDGIKAPLGN